MNLISKKCFGLLCVVSMSNLGYAMPAPTNKAIIALIQSEILKTVMDEAGYFEGLNITQVLNFTEEFSSVFLACGAGAASKSGTILKAEFTYLEYDAVTKLEKVSTQAVYFSTVGAGLIGDIEFTKCDADKIVGAKQQQSIIE